MACWVSVTLAQMVMAKQASVSLVPILFTSLPPPVNDGIREKLFHSAVQVAKFTCAMNTEKACRRWRWVYQTCTHGHAVVPLCIEIPRRPWSFALTGDAMETQTWAPLRR